MASNEQTPLLRDASHAEASDDTTKPSTWDRVRSWITRNAISITLALLLALFVALFVASIVNDQRRSSPGHGGRHHGAKVCTSAGCVLAASTILKSISPRHADIDPCNDFRAYACEGFDAAHEIRNDQTGVGSLQIMSEEGQLLLKRTLESSVPEEISLFWTDSSPDREIFEKMHNAYSACMNETHLEDVGSEPLLGLLFQLQEIYPVNKPKRVTDDSLTSAVEFLMKWGMESPISLGVGADDKDPDSNVISLSPPWSVGLPSKEYYNNSDIAEAYKSTIGAVLEKLLAEANRTMLAPLRTNQKPFPLNKKLIDNLFNFEAAIANAIPDPEVLADITKVYNPRTLKEADAYNPAISVKTLIDAFASGHKPSKIIVASPDYLRSLYHIIDAQNRETIFAYLVWKVVQAMAGSIEDEAVLPLRRFNNKLSGKEPDAKPERWRKCVSVVDSDLPWILSRFFIERAFSKEAKDLGDQIIYDIKDEFSRKLTHSEWMTKKVRKLAIDKVHLIRQKIGYPTKSPDITNAQELEDYYGEVTQGADSFFVNRLSSNYHEVQREWAKVGKPVDKNEWDMSAPTVNAYYNPPGNEIVFPAGIMQAPVFYDPSIPKYLSYGAFGAVAGHELSHAFDSSGRNYDQNGNYTDWWDEDTIKSFRQKTDCFVEQYHNYSIPTKDGPLPINGKLTLGENIADAGGLTAAFQSWRRRDAEKADLRLPGLQNFTKEQVFFLAYGLTWCGKTREEEMVRRIYTDPHSPAAFRIQGTTANSREFREAFNCPVKEPTCELW